MVLVTRSREVRRQQHLRIERHREAENKCLGIACYGLVRVVESGCCQRSGCSHHVSSIALPLLSVFVALFSLYHLWLAVGTGAGKILKGTGKGIGHIVGGGKCIRWYYLSVDVWTGLL